MASGNNLSIAEQQAASLKPPAWKACGTVRNNAENAERIKLLFRQIIGAKAAMLLIKSLHAEINEQQ
jgi:hypothetical protein